MKIEDQVVSAELAKELKELGIKQDGIFAWFRYKAHPPYIASKSLQRHEDNEATFVDGYAECPELICGTFTVAELGEMLKGEIREYVGNKKRTSYYLDCGKIDSENSCYVRYTRHDISHTFHITHGTKEADARAEMLIYLIKNGITKAEVVEK